jgi:xylulokinase
LAGVAAGIYESVEEAAENTVRITHTTEPNTALTGLYDDYYQLFRSLYPALKDRFREAARLEE